MKLVSASLFNHRFMTTTLLLAPLMFGGCDQFSKVVEDNKSKLDIPISTDYEFVTAFDIGGAMGAAAGQTTPKDLTQSIAPPPSDVDLVAEVQALKDAKGRVKSFEILKIEVTPTTNTVTSDLPAFDLFIGPISSSSAAAKRAAEPVEGRRQRGAVSL